MNHCGQVLESAVVPPTARKSDITYWSLFVTSVYLRYWFESPAAHCAPRNDLALLCTLSEYPSTEIARVATTAFERHLWCLSEILIAFAFFDDAVSTEEKRLMVAALREVEGQD